MILACKKKKKGSFLRGAKLKECPQKFDKSFLDLLMISTDAKIIQADSKVPVGY